MLAIHIGCFELFAHEGIRSIRDLKGKKVTLQRLGPSAACFVSSMAAYVGLDPGKDIDWVLTLSDDPKELFVERKVDAFLGFPPDPQELRARKIGHVIVNSADRSSLVAVLLLHAHWQSRVRAQESGGDQARAARNPQGDRLLRSAIPAAAARVIGRSGLHATLRLRAADVA